MALHSLVGCLELVARVRQEWALVLGLPMAQKGGRLVMASRMGGQWWDSYIVEEVGLEYFGHSHNEHKIWPAPASSLHKFDSTTLHFLLKTSREHRIIKFPPI